MSVVLSSEEFNAKVLNGTGKVLIDFFATWCGPCRMIAPFIEEIAEEKAGEVEVYKIDIDQSPDIARQFGIRGVPTLMVFEDGKPVSQMVGAQPKAQILQMLG
ncbi:MAG: thioredoxin [Eggerthellaceae bacterium]|nr:thioredoxin [Eggerthellaceae bacterium]